MTTSKIDYRQLANDMLQAMKAVISSNYNEVKNIATGELLDFAKRTVELAKKVEEGKITESQAKAILKIRQNAVETVLLSIAGIGLITAQEAINAAIGVLRGALDKAIPGVNIF